MPKANKLDISSVLPPRPTKICFDSAGSGRRSPSESTTLTDSAERFFNSFHDNITVNSMGVDGHCPHCDQPTYIARIHGWEVALKNGHEIYLITFCPRCAGILTYKIGDLINEPIKIEKSIDMTKYNESVYLRAIERFKKQFNW